MDKDIETDETVIDTSSLVQASTKHPIPYRIGPYKVKGLLKKGGTSLLYLGVHPDTNELIALKVLLPKFLTHPEMIGHFLKEAKIIEMANHPNIVRLYGHGEWEGGLYIAMEFVRGISLRKLIMQNILSFSRSLEIVLEAASALSHLHSHGIIHRDLKPDNIILSEDGGVKVIDFGVSRLLADDLNSKKKRVMGTPSYMSPEQKESPLSVSYPSDVYSLAIIAYELCIGRLCYGVVQLSQLPKGLRNIISKALMPKVEDRYEGIETFVSDLNQYIEHSFDEHEELLDLSLKELSDFYENVSFTLVPHHSNYASRLLLGKANPAGLLASHIYCDYLRISEDHLALFIAWPEKKGVQGMFNNAVLKGLVQVLQKELKGLGEDLVPKAEHFLKSLNGYIQDNTLNQYSISLLILSFSQDLLHFFSAGPNKLFLQRVGAHHVSELSVDNPLMGIDKEASFLHISNNYHIGDTLYLFNTYEKNALSLDSYSKAIEKNHLSTGHHQAKEILDTLSMNGEEKIKLPLMVTTLQRKR